MNATASIEDMVAQLDARDEKWDLYRCHDGRWVVSMRERGPGFDPSARSASGATIAAALAAAAASPRLPTVPRRPQVFDTYGFAAVKDGRKWKLCYGGAPVGFPAFDTRTHALACGERHAARSAAAEREWLAEWAAVVAAGVEGVDWRWEP